MDISHERNTKQKILDAALDLFSQKGFNAVSLEEIAQTVGIKAPSLYKHYKSKKDIFSACLSGLKDHYDESHLLMQEDDFDFTSVEAYVQKLQHQMEFILNDPMSQRFTRLCTMELGKNDELTNMMETLYFYDSYFYCKRMVQNLVDRKILRNEDVRIMTIQLASPITAYVSLCRMNPSHFERAKSDVGKHIRSFFELYRYRADQATQPEDSLEEFFETKTAEKTVQSN